MIAVIDYGVGNLFSLSSSLAYLGLENKITRSARELDEASHIILPGVGAFGDAMEKLASTGLVPELERQAENGKPLLGICLGMQLLFERGEEGASCGEWVEGLGLLRGSCVRFPACGLKIPHVGWDDVSITAQGKELFSGVSNGSHFYFTHSYIVEPDSEDVVACWTDYGVRFAAAVANDMVFGCQFHPEKSSGKGREVLRNFVRIVQNREEGRSAEEHGGKGLS